MTACHAAKPLLLLLVAVMVVACQEDDDLQRDKRRSEMLVLSPPGKNQAIKKELYLKQIKDQPLNLMKREATATEDDGEENEGETEKVYGGERQNKHHRDRNAVRSGPKVWDPWGKWSPCTVTCGLGKITRWRHCISGSCAPGEKEAQIKSCTLPAC